MTWEFAPMGEGWATPEAKSATSTPPPAGTRCYLCDRPAADRRLRAGHSTCGPCERLVEALVERRIRREREGAW